jgi:hypothetical protein
MSLHDAFLVVALILAILGAFPIPSRVSLGWLAFAFFIASLLVVGGAPLFGHR